MQSTAFDGLDLCNGDVGYHFTDRKEPGLVCVCVMEWYNYIHTQNELWYPIS